MKPSYYAVIPANVRYAAISANAKLLYGEITALTSKEGYCWASNEYFAKLYGVHPDTITAWVTALRKAGFIESVVEKGTDRKLFIIQTGRQKDLPPPVKSPTTGRQKDRHINKVNNTTNTGEATASQAYEIVPDGEVKPRKVAKPAHAVFSIFREFGLYQLNWTKNRSQLQAAENLLAEHGEEQIRKALEFYRETKNEPFCPQILTPWDLDAKWTKLLAFKAK